MSAMLRRRTALKAFGAAPLALMAGGGAMAAAEPRSVVDGIEIFHLKVNQRGNWVIVRLRAANGLTGLGDAGHAEDEVTIRYLRQFAELWRGRSVFEIEPFRRAVADIVRTGGDSAAVAASALEQALWDLAGKALGVPVYQLFGGKLRDTIPLYANINRSTVPRTPEGFAKMASAAIADGFRAIKLAPFDAIPMGETDRAKIARLTDEGIACAQAVRDTIGPDNDLLIDVHSRFNLADGLKLAERFEPLKLYWLEEVTPAEPLSDLAAINHAAKMPTAGGESITTVEGFYDYIRAGTVDIVMPDIKFCGGLSQLRKIAGIAEGAGLPVSPHGPASPVGNAAAAHVVATLPNFTILEYAYGEVPWRADLLDPPERIGRGELILTDRPGFGIELNERTAARYSI
ncbi:MAG: mandelate racemase/muconate lactonizing enzyme family protein [Candidatus Andeanibacterium colombiense]|uniref:Mandelate racemase/muconate lactonizing enzyme family protein n=1 Tax=Candidatus Andeanibacterium colombiense TaxID=3121345 RepID=A0AAJ5X5G1_9SPHN|nr:MAG: mandelate racemase/muconate lactonizing enzyme family protein [Sphingomonadaceae bacterium]